MKKTVLRHPARVAGSSFLRLQSDERLAELAAGGHDAAFDAIVHRYRPALLRYCGAIVGSSRAEDAVQQTLLNAHTALADTDEVRHLRSWLYRIAHNASLNLLRGVRDDVSLDGDGVAAALPASASPAESFEASEQFRATVAALQALPERQRAALVLRELEGRSHEEIADALGVSAGSARQHLMRARVAMRGAVTAVTPWGLIVRIADMASAGGGPPGGLEAAAGAGLGAGLVKLTAGVMATGALVGGAAVGTHEVVRHDSAAPAQADTIHPAAKAATSRRAATATPTISAAALTSTTAHRSSGTSHRSGEAEHRGRGRGRRGGSGSGKSDDHSGEDRSGRGRDGGGDDDAKSQAAATPLTRADDHGSDHSGSGSSGTSGSSRSGSSGSSGRGRGGSDDSSGSDDSGSSGSGSSGSGSSGSGSSGSGKSSGGSGSSSTTSTAAPAPAPTTSDSGSSGASGSGSGSSGSSGSGDSGSSGSSGSGSSGSGTPSDDGSSSGSSGSGKSGDDG